LVSLELAGEIERQPFRSSAVLVKATVESPHGWHSDAHHPRSSCGANLMMLMKKVTSWAAIIAVPTAVTASRHERPLPGYGQC
jgi:hypothetical protein